MINNISCACSVLQIEVDSRVLLKVHLVVMILSDGFQANDTYILWIMFIQDFFLW
jgi:hypothetical protein